MTVTYFYVICWFVKSCFEVLSWAFLSSWCHKSRRAGFNIRLHAHWVITCYWQLTVFWGLISQILHFETWYEQALQNTTFFNLIWPKMSEWGYKSSRNALTEVETEANRHLWDWKSFSNHRYCHLVAAGMQINADQCCLYFSNLEKCFIPSMRASFMSSCFAAWLAQR